MRSKIKRIKPGWCDETPLYTQVADNISGEELTGFTDDAKHRGELPSSLCLVRDLAMPTEDAARHLRTGVTGMPLSAHFTAMTSRPMAGVGRV